MSTKSKSKAMETNESESVASIRPSRNLKPVSYVDNGMTGKRTTTRAVKEPSEPIDKRKKKVNGNSNGEAPPKKTTGGKKAADAIEEEKTEQDLRDGTDGDELMPEPHAKSKSAAEKVPAKKAVGRKKKAEETAVTDTVDEAPVDESVEPKQSKIQRKGKEPIPVANEEGSSEPIDSKAAPSKPARGKKIHLYNPEVEATTIAKPRGKRGVKEPSDAEAESNSPPESSKKVIDADVNGDTHDTKQAKPVVSKTVKGKKGVKTNSQDEDSTKAVTSKTVASKGAKGKKVADVEVESDGQEESPAETVATKTAKGSKKGAKESNGTTDEKEVAEQSKPKGRSKKPAATKGNFCLHIVRNGFQFEFCFFNSKFFFYSQSLIQSTIRY